SDILAFNEDSLIEEQTVSEDGTTIMIPFQVSLEDQDVDEARENIYQAVEDIHVDHELTGEKFISQDIIKNSEEGLKRTEMITVGLILVILLVVFKSFVAPFVPLLTVGISYLAAQGIVSILADKVDFPLSSFTQIFMVVVMFGIGTDYCILLISRFKEEVANNDSIQDAVLATYKSGGRTIFFAGIVVLIGFSTIGLSTFSLYQSAVAVAVGVAVVLIALATLVPFFLVVLGKKLFWPFDKKVEHAESKIWGAAGNFAWKRPFAALLIIAVIVIPSLINYQGSTSYDSLAEIGDGYSSVSGFNWIADSFGPGQAMPMNVVVETENEIDAAEDFQAIASISQELAELDGVEQVRSATRPTGEIIEDFLVDNQTDSLSEGIGQSTEGIQEIESGLRDAASELDQSAPQLEEAQEGVGQLMQGTEDANNGISEISSALTEIENGIQSGSQGAEEISSNLQTVKGNLDQTISGNQQLLQGYQAIAKGLSDFGTSSMDPDDLNEMISTLESSKTNMESVFNTAVAANPGLQQDQGFMEAYMTAQGQIDGVIEAVEQMQQQLGQLAGIQTQLEEQVIAPLNELNSGLEKSIDGQQQLSAAIGELITGIEQLQSGLNQAASGQGQVVDNLPGLQDGLSQIYGGQEELNTAFASMQDQLEQLSSGLNEGSDGLQQVDNGLSEIGSYLDELDMGDNPLVLIPEEALENEDFMKGTESYVSEDKTITKFEVILSSNPYSTEAMEMVDLVKDTVNDAKDNTLFEDSDPKIGGISSTNNDLQNISDKDFSRTVILMISGIFIMLVILLRGIIMPLYLIGSLVLTYFTSMGVGEFIFVKLLGYDGMTWAIPFFAFVMLMALGIDYSIFLMDRFNEYRDISIKEALLQSMKKMGTVILSAAIILGGTFGAMLPSGVLSLLQIATVVLTGLFLYAFIMLPLFIPIMVRLFGKYNWWPFKHHMK
ncbi:MMPL family transporter, partial [Oceanobacillus massiliensis]|uniref:MMPL family transporter n=1 Tax=Oceanobacillus massiliensis TaxID=1465765 RepID=UPI00301A49EB